MKWIMIKPNEELPQKKVLATNDNYDFCLGWLKITHDRKTGEKQITCTDHEVYEMDHVVAYIDIDKEHPYLKPKNIKN